MITSNTGRLFSDRAAARERKKEEERREKRVGRAFFIASVVGAEWLGKSCVNTEIPVLPGGRESLFPEVGSLLKKKTELVMMIFQ